MQEQMDLCTSKFELNMLVFVKCNTECLVVSGLALSHLWLYGCGLTACRIPLQLCKIACAIFIVFIALALQLRVFLAGRS